MRIATGWHWSIDNRYGATHSLDSVAHRTKDETQPSRRN